MDEDNNIGIILVGLAGLYIVYNWFIAPQQQATANKAPAPVGINQFSAYQSMTQAQTPQETPQPFVMNRDEVAAATGQTVQSINLGNAPQAAGGRGIRGRM